MTRTFRDTRGDICAADLPRLLSMAGLTRLPAGMDAEDLRDELLGADTQAKRESLDPWHPLHPRSGAGGDVDDVTTWEVRC